jgi:hypothetical protein
LVIMVQSLLQIPGGLEGVLNMRLLPCLHILLQLCQAGLRLLSSS